jgi:hypothetical protein
MSSVVQLTSEDFALARVNIRLNIYSIKQIHFFILI